MTVCYVCYVGRPGYSVERGVRVYPQINEITSPVHLNQVFVKYVF